MSTTSDHAIDERHTYSVSRLSNEHVSTHWRGTDQCQLHLTMWIDERHSVSRLSNEHVSTQGCGADQCQLHLTMWVYERSTHVQCVTVEHKHVSIQWSGADQCQLHLTMWIDERHSVSRLSNEHVSTQGCGVELAEPCFTLQQPVLLMRRCGDRRLVATAGSGLCLRPRPHYEL